MNNQPSTSSAPVPWKRVAVFVSSTFSDMHAERDCLVKRVFPDLHDWCERRRLRLVDVDLRWGVTEADATENRNVVQTCLKRIDECRPFFLCFVGQRRGWVPMPEEIHPRTLEAFPELRRHIGKASVTELEILHAILRPLHGDAPHDPARAPDTYRPADHAFFYLRDPSYLGRLLAQPPELLEAYTNAGCDDPAQQTHDDTELQRWREVEIPKCGRPIHSYSAQWNPALSTPELALPLVCPATAEQGRDRWRKRWTRAGVGLALDGLRVADENQAHDFNRRLTAGRLSEFWKEDHDLAAIILDDLKRGIEARYPEHVEAEGKPGSLQAELDQQEHFLFVNSEGFIERGNDFGELDEYVRGDSRKLFMLTAEGGMGKSMLLANWIDRCRAEGSPLSETPFLFRFVGQSDGSTTAANVQASLLTELRDVHGRLPETVRVKEEQKGPPGTASESVERDAPLEFPGDPVKLLEFWREWLPKAAAHGKCVIVIDALNQLAEGLEHLHWLPQGQLPDGLKFIVSFRRGAPGSERLIETWRGSHYADKVQLAEVRPFKEKAHRRALVDAYLDQYLKALDDHLIEELISVEGAANPLFLKIVLSELRVFGSFEQLSMKIRTDFGTDPVSAFRAVLRRLISDPAYAPLPSAQSVPVVFGTLACARGGLSVDELSDILCRALGQATPTDDQLRNAREAVLVILRQERPFLARRDGRYDFFFESFQTAAREAFCFRNSVDEAHDNDAGPRQPLPCKPSARPTMEWHSLIADHYAAQPNTNRRRLSELPHHLTSAEHWDDLIGNEETAGPLSDLLFIQAKCEAGMVYELAKDYNAALAALPEFREENERNRRRDAAMAAYNQALREYAVVRCDWWFAKERGEMQPEPPYPPLPAELRNEAEMPIPEENSDRAARLRHFSNFVSGHLALLTQFPKDTLPLANNRAEGPVAETAKRTILESKLPVLCRSPRPPNPSYRPQCVRTLEDHTDSVSSVSVSPDGRRAVSGSEDLTLRIWDLETGACLRILKGHTSYITSVSVSTCGLRAVSTGNWDNMLRVWDLETGAFLHILNGHTNWVTGVSISPDGRRAVSGSYDKTLRVWDLETGACLRTIEGHKVTSVSVSPDGRRAVSGCWHNTLRLWDLETGACLRIFKGHTREVSSVSVSPDSRRAISGSWDNTLRVWDLETGACLRTLEGHTDSVNSVSVSPDGRRAVSGSWDNTLRLWDLEAGACLRIFNGHTNWVRSVSVSPDGRRAVSGSDDKILRVWNLETDACLRTLEGHTSYVKSVSVSSDGRHAVSGSGDETLRVWDLESGECLHTLEGHTESVSSVNVSLDDHRAVSGSRDETLRVWDLENGVCLRTLEGHTDWISSVSVTPDGRRAVSCSRDNTLRVWDLESRECLRTLEGHDRHVTSVAVTPDGRRAVSGSWDKTVRLWDLEKGVCLRTLEGHTSDITSVSVSPDGRRAVSAGCDNTLRFWDMKTGTCMHTLKGHTNQVRSVSVSPDGRRAVSGSGDNTLRVWNLETGACLHTLEGHTDWVSVCVSPDGQRAVSGSYDKTLRVWDLETGACLITYHAGSKVGSEAITPTGERIVCGTNDGQVHLLTLVNIPTAPPVVTAARLWNSDSAAKPSFWNAIWRWFLVCHPVSGRWDDRLTALCPWCGRRFPVRDDMPGQQILCPLDACGKPLQLNPFVVDIS